MPPVNTKNRNASKKNAKKENNKSKEETEDNVAISGQLNKKMKRSQARIDRQRGVVIVRRLPHGFFEDQLKNYFQQFGKVTRLRLARSKRTGGSKGFAFVEFEYPEVAKVAAETMDNYLMFQKVVKAQYIPPEEQRFNYFRSSIRQVVNKVGKPIYVSSRTAAIQKQTDVYNKWTEKDYEKRVSANVRKLKIFKKKYADLGIDFDKFIVRAKRQPVTTDEKPNETQDNEKNATTEQNTEPGSLLLIKKRKKQDPKEGAEIKKAKAGNSGKKLELKDLLDNTLKDDTEDEDFIPVAEGDSNDTSDEETYGIMRTNTESEESDGETCPLPKSYEKSSKVDRMAELLKRKPNTGGIKKINKKKLKQSKPSSVKNNLKLAAANEIKEQGKIVQIKKKDLKKKKSQKK